jgi:hypothetical protein
MKKSSSDVLLGNVPEHPPTLGNVIESFDRLVEHLRTCGTGAVSVQVKYMDIIADSVYGKSLRGSKIKTHDTFIDDLLNPGNKMCVGVYQETPTTVRCFTEDGCSKIVTRDNYISHQVFIHYMK